MTTNSEYEIDAARNTMKTRELVNGSIVETNWEWNPIIGDWVKSIPQSPALELEPQNDRVILPKNW